MDRRILGMTAVLALIACDAQDPVAGDANRLDGNSSIEVLPPDESAAAGDPADNGQSGSDALAQPLIPAALQGRWGLVPADCTSTRGDAKGLLTIRGDALHFYESVARPSPGVQSSEKSVSGNFAFRGEGSQWTKPMTLTVEGHKLVRTEDEPAISYTYVRCG